MVNKPKSEEDIYYAALKEPPDGRSAYIKAACGDDSELLERVESLLKIRENPNNFLESPLFIDQPLTNISLQEQPGTIIDRYKLLEKIGEGGMAVVYMGEQTDPIRRKVALKIIKLGMDTKQVIARFEAERQALAMMDHPNIAKVLDAGATETGRPYFVMELVTGVSITEYCDKNNLSTKERLALFIQVCNAVQHAHQKGIIHRDIKPTNVMVTRHEGQPVPKVIDFGIAKAINQKLTEKTLFTRYAHIIGTPAYMSPEQADLGDLDVDTRSDIYSLGVLLYELLTGTTPFSEEDLRKAGYLEMQRVIREQEPPKPSTKLSTLGETLTDIAKYRGCTADLLRKAIRGDLDWIVMKALEKTRNRRYDTVSVFAMDVQRYLNDEPIFARAPSTVYCLRKFLQRHRSKALVALTISVLSSSLIIILLLLNHSRLQLSRAESEHHKRMLYETYMSYIKGDHASAIKNLRSIVNSKHVGSEAQFLYDSILSNAGEQITYYNSRIEANPKGAENYLHRAQYYFYQQDEERVLADMDTYAAILNPSAEASFNNSWIQDFLRGLWRSTRINLEPTINSQYNEAAPSISPDGLSLFFCSDRPGGHGAFDIWVTTRAITSGPWGPPVNLGESVNGHSMDGSTTMSVDGLSLYFASNRSGGSGSEDIWVCKRSKEGELWDKPENLGPIVNTSSFDWGPSISADSLSLFFDSTRPGGHGGFDIWVTTRKTVDDNWGAPVNLGPVVNSPSDEGAVSLSADGLVLFFISDRPGGYGLHDIWITWRTSSHDPWSIPVNLGPTVNTSSREGSPEISADGLELYFDDVGLPAWDKVRGFDLWQVKITPISGSL